MFRESAPSSVDKTPSNHELFGHCKRQSRALVNSSLRMSIKVNSPHSSSRSPVQIPKQQPLNSLNRGSAATAKKKEIRWRSALVSKINTTKSRRVGQAPTT